MRRMDKMREEKKRLRERQQEKAVIIIAVTNVITALLNFLKALLS